MFAKASLTLMPRTLSLQLMAITLASDSQDKHNVTVCSKSDQVLEAGWACFVAIPLDLGAKVKDLTIWTLTDRSFATGRKLLCAIVDFN